MGQRKGNGKVGDRKRKGNGKVGDRKRKGNGKGRKGIFFSGCQGTFNVTEQFFYFSRKKRKMLSTLGIRYRKRIF